MGGVAVVGTTQPRWPGELARVVIILPYNEDVARTWGRISAAAIQRGRPRPANDTWIAACALAYGLPLATLHTKDFKDFAAQGGLNLIIQAGAGGAERRREDHAAEDSHRTERT